MRLARVRNPCPGDNIDQRLGLSLVDERPNRNLKCVDKDRARVQRNSAKTTTPMDPTKASHVHGATGGRIVKVKWGDAVSLLPKAPLVLWRRGLQSEEGLA